MSVIETHALRRTFQTRGSTVEAVVGVDLHVQAGEVFGFLGPNGAGKTTTLRMLSTLLPPSGGEAIVVGYDLLRQPRKVRERIGYVGQRNGSDPGVTARRELEFQARLYGASGKEARQRTAEVLSMLELDSCADRPASTYSGGQRRRLDIGIGLIHSPNCCSWTSQLLASTRRAARGCGTKSAVSKPRG
jgi:ABC-2 type transport system ATP-binding protein